ncbi:hypothetical protein GCM10007933_02720 [Zoogloea oryzae]|uniref:Uncharacterized protein n=1 Tax=Zoogloea oryzae TaxID=310767 RepID=A0ABQ6F7J1_9RHOO|nr:hypothetical protein GCM10007933_02720 [Zoogloea oryzae]
MIRLYSPQTRPFSEVSYFGVAISGNDEQRHIGLLCNASPGANPKFVHLAFHFRLRCDDANGDAGCWIDCSGAFDEDERINLSSWAVKVYEKNGRKIPYGFPYSSDMSQFDESGKFSDVSRGAGLTCATFALSILDLAGYTAVDSASWEVRGDDVVWQLKIISELAKDRENHPELYVDYPEQDQFAHVGIAVRMRPEEAAAAIGGYEGVPMAFSKARVLGEDVIRQLLNGAVP